MREYRRLRIDHPANPVKGLGVQIRFNRVSKNCVSGRDPALRGFCKCSHISEYAPLSKTPRAWADGLILVFQHPVKEAACQTMLIGESPR